MSVFNAVQYYAVMPKFTSFKTLDFRFLFPFYTNVILVTGLKYN